MVSSPLASSPTKKTCDNPEALISAESIFYSDFFLLAVSFNLHVYAEAHTTEQLSLLIPGCPCLGEEITQKAGNVEATWASDPYLHGATQQVLTKVLFSSHLTFPNHLT